MKIIFGKILGKSINSYFPKSIVTKKIKIFTFNLYFSESLLITYTFINITWKITL